MDNSRGQKDSRERLYPRAPSRASTASSANISMTAKSANSSSSHLRETSHTGSHPAHKYHHSHCGSVGGSRPMSRLSGEPGEELREPVMATSSLLQEKLQKERKIESERQAGKLSSDLSASTGDIRDKDVKSSPVRRSATAMGRPEKLDGGDEFPRDTGMGLRQMEETLSTLHKQNWDLKVQLFHRRKQQIILEGKLQTLETRNKEMMDLHDSMLSSLQAKDETHKSLCAEIDEKNKALGEAVSLIIKLEARVDELLREREMVRQVEADEPYRYPPDDELDLEPGINGITGTTKMDSLTIPRLTEHAKKLGRMPSFLSERGEETENLRNVVLRGQNSVMRMRKVSESSADPSEINRIASPLSVLSESSFISIYGPKEAREKAGLQLSDDVAGMDGSYVARSATPARKASKESWDGQKNTTPNQMSTAGGAKLSTRMQSINNILDMDSPLQKLERLEGQIAATDDSYSQPMPLNRSRGAATPTPRSVNPPQQGKSKHEKREALQKVMTNYPTHKDFANSHAFPPTPDTVSSSILRKHQNFTSSQDSLKRQVTTGQYEGALASYERPRTATRESAYQRFPEQQGFATNLPSRTQAAMPDMDTHAFSSISQLAQSLPRRPHSAAETTSSRARADSIGSDSDSDGGADAHSEADSFDYWMRESMRESKKPNRHETVSPEQRGSGRAPSPDLFSFPTDARGWETDVMFGALRGNGYLGSPIPALKRDPLDEMASLLQTSQAEMLDSPMQGTAPPTPDRRSSLHAHTGSTSAAPSGGKLRKNPARGGSTGWIDTRGRSNSIDSAAQAPPSRMQRQQSEATAIPGKRNHYPPISGQATKGRGLGLNTFFKRSGSESFSVPSSATDATFPLPTPNQVPPLAPPMPSAMAPGRSSVPPPAAMPWFMRPPAAPEDDFASATPPPIMRNRGPSLLSGTGGLELADPATPSQHVAETATPSTPTTAIPPQGTSTTPSGAQSGGKRKWLGLGRRGSVKNKTG
ncbi:hypothetical protein F4818DRAFT_259664 [Hypoxylon cercidicola]|nr:hypothetical protein F4818DRAFT_259664 [Hypoxylon cercidicola]